VIRRALIPLAVLLFLAPEANATLSLSTPPSFGNFASVQLNGSPQTTTASVSNWTVNATLHTLGWNVTMAATQFQTAGGVKLPLNSLQYRGPSTSGVLSLLVGNLTTVTLDRSADGSSSVGIVSALPAVGAGVWTMTQGSADLILTVPPQVLAGTYTSTITTTLTSGTL
jgi:hypothetical protein